MQMTSTQSPVSRVVSKLPICHFCLEEAVYEGKTVYGYQASMCPRDFKRVGPGISEVQRLIVIERNAPVVSPSFFTPRKRGFGFSQDGGFMAPAFA